MKTKKNSLFTRGIVAVYVAVIVFLGLSLFLEYNKGQEKAEYRFKELCRETSENLKINSPNSRSFQTAFLRSVGNLNDIAAIKVEYNGNVIVSYPREFSLMPNSRSAMITVKEEKLNAQRGEPVTITAAIYKLKPSTIYDKSRAAFLVILIATLLCVIYLIYYYLTEQEGEASPKEIKIADTIEDSDEFFSVSDDSSDDVLDTDTEDTINIDLKDSTEPPSKDENTVQTQDADTSKNIPDTLQKTLVIDAVAASMEEEENNPDTGTFKQDFGGNLTEEEFQALTDDYYDDSTENETSEKEEKPIEEVQAESTTEPIIEEEINDAPHDIYNTGKSAIEEDEVIESDVVEEANFTEPVIEEEEKIVVAEEPAIEEVIPEEDKIAQSLGILPNKDIIPCLDKELIAASSSEQDVTLLLISLKDFDWSSEESKLVVDVIKNTFTLPDSIFHYTPKEETLCEGLAIIIKDKNIDEALNIVKDLHTNIIASIGKKGLYNSVAMGLSAKSLRIISSTRLLSETEGALDRAQKDKESPIMAFKVNPEKYRNFIANEKTSAN